MTTVPPPTVQAGTRDAWKSWAGAHNAAIMAVLFLVFGLKRIGGGIAVLS